MSDLVKVALISGAFSVIVGALTLIGALIGISTAEYRKGEKK